MRCSTGSLRQTVAAPQHSTCEAEDKSAEEDQKKAEANRKRPRKGTQATKRKSSSHNKKNFAKPSLLSKRLKPRGPAKWDRALELFDKAGSWDKLLKVEWLVKADKFDKAIELAEAEAKANPGTVLPGAVATFVRWQLKGPKKLRKSLRNCARALA